MDWGEKFKEISPIYKDILDLPSQVKITFKDIQGAEEFRNKFNFTYFRNSLLDIKNFKDSIYENEFNRTLVIQGF